MDKGCGYYSIIQFCPDRSRMEVVNIGLILAYQDRVMVRVIDNNERVKRFFGSVDGLDWEQMDGMKEGIVGRIMGEVKDVDGLRNFIKTRANEIVITEPRSVLMFDMEDDMRLLFERLVG